MDEFIKAAAGKLPNAVTRLAPAALAYWSAVVLAWAWHYPTLPALRVELHEIAALAGVEQLALAAAVCLTVSVSIVLVERLTQLVLPTLANPWPRPLRHIHALGVKRQLRKASALRDEWDTLSRPVFDGTASAKQVVRLNVVDGLLRNFPTEGRTGATRTANVLRATWLRPQQRTGVSTNVILPRLYQVLPESAHTDLTTQWTALTSALSYAVWSVLLLPALYWCRYVPILAVAGLAVAWFELPRRAERYGGTLEAAMDLHRFDVLDKLHWPLPTSTDDEREHGQNLTAYLVRGESRNSVQFRHPQP